MSLQSHPSSSSLSTKLCPEIRSKQFAYAETVSTSAVFNTTEARCQEIASNNFLYQNFPCRPRPRCFATKCVFVTCSIELRANAKSKLLCVMKHSAPHSVVTSGGRGRPLDFLLRPRLSSSFLKRCSLCTSPYLGHQGSTLIQANRKCAQPFLNLHIKKLKHLQFHN